MTPLDVSHEAVPTAATPLEELHRRYHAYRRRQATILARMLPREAIRPLVRRARESAPSSEDADPLETLVRLCEAILPLPPFEVWREDVGRHPDAYLRDLAESVEAPTADAPSTVEVRPLSYRGQWWLAHLRSFRDGPAWRAYISFEEPRSGRVYRTATVFREDDPSDLRERFLTFDAAALEAFLRSSLP